MEFQKGQYMESKIIGKSNIDNVFFSPLSPHFPWV